MLTFFLTVIEATFVQFIGVMGIFFAFGFILSKFQEWTQRNYYRSVGWKGILWTAWIGTPIHEFGHWVFAKIFRHDITRTSLFRPNRQTGELGHMEHRYNPASLYQKLGNFFIGAAPMIFGSMAVWLMAVFLLPGGRDAFAPLLGASAVTPEKIFAAFKETIQLLLGRDNIRSWHFWLFLYMSFSVIAHSAPSKADRVGMWRGLRWMILLLFLLNLFAAVLQLDITAWILRTNQYLHTLTAIFLYAVLLSAIHWLVSVILLRPLRR